MGIGAEKIREARRKYLASLSPEERKEIEKTKREAEAESRKKWMEIGKLITGSLEANAHHEKAIAMLKNAIQSAAEDPAMTPEIKEVAEILIYFIEDREPFQYDLEAFLEPVVKIVKKDTKSESGKNAAKGRHAGSYKLHNEIKDIWASGKYSSRDKCAEDEYSALGFGSFKAARNALKGTPDPSPWAAKSTKKQ